MNTQKKITLSILILVLVTSLSVGGFSILFSINTMRENTNNYLSDQTNAHALELDSVIIRIETAVTGIEKNVLGQIDTSQINDPAYYERFTKDIETMADQFIRNDFNAMSIYVRFDPDLSYGTAGVFYADTDADGVLERLVPTDLTKFEATDRERVAWFYEPLEEGKQIWLQPYYNANIGIEMVSFVKPLIVEGKTIGIVGADINFDQLRSIAEKQLVAGKIAIVDQEQHFLVHDIYGITERMDTIDEGRLKGVYDALNASENGLMRYVLEGEEKILGYSRLRNGWTVIVAVTLQDAFTEINRSMATFMSVIGTISVVMVVSSIYLGNYINKVMMSNSVLQGLVDERTEQLNETNTYLQNSLAEIQNREAELTVLNSQLEDTLEEMNKLQAQVIRTEKLQSLGTIVNGLSHEINTPLGLIITTNSYLSTKIQQAKESDKLKVAKVEIEDINEGLFIIDKASQKLRRLVKSFKMLTTDTTIKDIKKFDLITLLASVEADMHESIEVLGHVLEISGEKSAVLISYPEVIEYIMKQLISNTIIHGAPDGRELLIKLHVEKEGRAIRIRYSDNGVGISGVTSEKMFEPFYSTSKHKGHVGLGLHIVHNLVTQVLNGHMEVVDTMENGFGLNITFYSQQVE